MKAGKMVFYLLFVTQLFVITFFWLQTSGGDLLSIPSFSLMAIGRLLGLLGVYFVLIQVILRGRVPMLERTFGFETLNRLHKKNGYVAFTFFFLHPIVLTVAYAMAGRMNIIAQLFLFLFTFDEVMKAFIGWILLISIVITSVYIVRNKLRYELWYFIHLGTYIAIFFAWGHQLRIGTDFAANIWFVYYWYGLYTVVFGSLLYWRVLTIGIRYYKYRFYVDKVTQETDDTVSVYIKGKNLQSFSFEPGQFLFIRFLAKGYWWESHPFSFSAVPNGEYIRLTIKAEGDFTAKIKNLQPGTKLTIDGPHGAFTERFMTKKKVVFIAGGVGITPIRSLIEGIDNRKKMILFYGNRFANEIIFKQELDELAAKYKFPVYHVISREEQYNGFKGRVTVELISQKLKEMQKYNYFLCGPNSMMLGLAKDLQSRGIPKEQIYFESFVL